MAAPGVQGLVVAGTHGTGVKTPNAAAVAAETAGFPMEMHIPNGMMFTMGMWSMMFASGTELVWTLLSGRTTSELGAIPKLHIIVAPWHT